MFVLLSRIIVTLLIIFIIKNLWDEAGKKDSPVFQRLAIMLIVTLLILAFFAPDNMIGAAVASVLSFLLKPLGLSITLLVVATTLITNGGIKNPAPTLLIVALVILILSSLPIIAFWLAERAEGEAVQAIKIDACCRETAGAIVLLGRGTTQARIPDRVSIQLTDRGDIIPFGALLYRRELAPYVIISASPRFELEGQVSEAQDIKSLLVSMGVPSERIILEQKSMTLRSSAEEVKKILNRRGLGSRVILVTSAVQIRRASLAFAEVGIKVIPRATNFYAFQSSDRFQRRLGGGDFFPSAEALLITTRVIDEYLAYLYYFLRGWLAPNI